MNSLFMAIIIILIMILGLAFWNDSQNDRLDALEQRILVDTIPDTIYIDPTIFIDTPERDSTWWHDSLLYRSSGFTP